MPESLAITFGGGGSSDSGPSGLVIVLLIVVLLVGVPVVLGFMLRARDAKCRGTVEAPEGTTSEPPESRVFNGGWGRSSGSVLRESTRRGWIVVAAFVVAVVVLFVLT